MNMFGIAGIIALAMSVGYLFGRRENQIRWKERIDTEDEENLAEPRSQGMQESDHAIGRRKHENQGTRYTSDRRKVERREKGKTIRKGEVIASPVAGKLNALENEGGKGVAILSEEGNVYAPVSGKITKLYPMGNAFIIRMEDRTELQVRVGGHPDELCAMYFCPRVIQNEIVNKGKLLLVFDREHLLAAGEDATVTIRVEEGMNEREVVITEASRVKVGDDVMQIYREGA